MKKSVLLLAIIIALGIMPKKVEASHFAGAELTYKCLGGNNYKITLIFYRDCSGINAPAQVQINFACSSNASLNFSQNLNKLPSSGQDISYACSSIQTYCSGGNNFGIQEYVYEGTTTIAPCDHWTISYSSCCRNPVTTLYNNSSNSWYIKATLDNLHGPQSSSPEFIRKPLIIAYIGTSYSLNMGAIDPNGDSLHYSFFTPFKNSNSTISYSMPYSASNFLVSSTFITLDPNTGIVSFTPSMALLTVLGIKIEKWRKINGTPQLIGEIYREVEMKVISSTTNPHVPVLSGMDFSNSHQYNPNDTIYYKEVCEGSNIDFDINAMDSDSGTTNAGKMEITWNQGINGAVFTTYNSNTDSAYAHFSWVASSTNNSKTRCFSATVKDNGCPYNALNAFTYCFFVKDTASISLNASDTTLCTGDSLLLTAQTTPALSGFSWKKNGQTITGASTNSLMINTTTYPTGKDTFIVTFNGSAQYCQANDTIVIDNVYQPHVHLKFPDTSILAGDSLVCDAGQGMMYKWMDQQNNVLGTAQTQVFKHPGNYRVIVDGGINTRCTDADTFALQVIGGIDEHSGNRSFKIVPNPNKGDFKIVFDNTATGMKNYLIEVYSPSGKLVYSENFTKTNEKDISLKGLSKGTYFIIIQGEKQKIKRSFIVN